MFLFICRIKNINHINSTEMKFNNNKIYKEINEFKLELFKTENINAFIDILGKNYFGGILNMSDIDINNFEAPAKIRLNSILEIDWENNIYKKYDFESYCQFYIWFCVYAKITCKLIDHFYDKNKKNKE